MDPKGKYPYVGFNQKKYLPKYPGEVAESGKMTSQRTYTGSSAPTVNNDQNDTAGIEQIFEVGDGWYDESTDISYRCHGNSPGAASWAADGNWKEQNILYVGKHGVDTNDGKNISNPFLTFTAAIAAATALTPTTDNRISIVCLDAAEYTEDIAVVSWVGVIALGAKIIGNHTVTDNSLLQSFRLVASTGTCVTKAAGTGSTTVICQRMILSASAGGVMCTSGTVNYSGESMSLVNGFGFGNLSSSDVNVVINEINITGTGIGIGIASTGKLVFNSQKIMDSGSGTGVYLASTGTVNASISEINCDTAFNVSAAGATLNLICSSITGTKASVGTLNYFSTDAGGEAAGNYAISGYFTQAGIYGGIHVHDNAVVQSIPTGATYTKSTAFADNEPSSNVTADATNDKITITQTGVYRVEGSFSFACATNNVTFLGSPFLNGVEQDNIHFTRKIQTAGDIGNAGFTGFIDVTTVPWDLDMRFRHDNGGAIDLTVSYANLNVQYMGET